MADIDFKEKIENLHKACVSGIALLMNHHNAVEVDLLGSNADHAYVTGYPSEGSGAMTMEVSKVYWRKGELLLDVILDVDTDELAAKNENGDISEAYQVWNANDFSRFIPCAGIDGVYEAVWQVLEGGKGCSMKRVDLWLNKPVDIEGYLDIIHIDTIHEGDEYIEAKDKGILYFSEMDEEMLASVLKLIDENEGKCIVGKKVAFDYNGKHYEREIRELCKVYWDSWVGDLGFEDEENDQSDSFLIHGNTDSSHNPVMEGLTIQYDSTDGSRHGYIKEVVTL